MVTNRLKDHSILIVGGAGFIGTNLSRVLAERGAMFHLFDNLSAGTGEFCSEESLTIGNIEDLGALRDCILANRCSAIVHLAGQTGVPVSVAHPVDDFRANALGTLNVLEAARQCGVQRVLTISSNASVGDVAQPTNEESLPRPVSPYGAHKLYVESITRVYAQNYGMETASIRLANVYGPYSTHKSSVVSSWLRHIVRGEPVIVYGGGSSTRDFIFVKDLASILCYLLLRRVNGDTICVGTGVETSVGLLVQMIRTIVGYDFPVQQEPLRPGEVERNFADVSKLQTLLPRDFHFTPLQLGLSLTWEWYQSELSAPF